MYVIVLEEKQFHLKRGKLDAYLTGQLQPFSQDCNLISHTTHVVRVSRNYKWQNLQFYVDSEYQNFWHIFYNICILFLLLIAERNIFLIFQFARDV